MPAAAPAAAAPSRRTRLIRKMNRARHHRRARAFPLALLLAACAVALPVSARAQPADAPADAAKASVASEIRAGVSGKLKDFYGPRGYWPLWVEKDAIGPQADALLALITSVALLWFHIPLRGAPIVLLTGALSAKRGSRVAAVGA